MASKLATVTTGGGDEEERLRGELAMVAARPAAARSPFPLEAAFTLGIGISALFGFVAWYADPRRRRRRDVEPALAGERSRR